MFEYKTIKNIFINYIEIDKTYGYLPIMPFD